MKNGYKECDQSKSGFESRAAAPCLPQHPPSSCFSPGILWSNVSDSNIESYRNYLRCNTPKLPEDTLSCTDPSCSQHNRVLDAYAEKLVSTLIIAGKSYLPTRSPTYRTLPGWNDSCKDLKQDADFWYNIWNEAGRPPPVVFFLTLRKVLKGSISRLLGS